MSSLPVFAGEPLVLCIDLPSSKILFVSGNTESINEPTTVGSTIKPFIAIAAMNSAFDSRQKVHCPASNVQTLARERCWLVLGHGNVDLKDALANSCSVYFRFLARRIGWKTIRRTLLDYSLIEKGEYSGSKKPDEEDLIGATDLIRIRPGRLLGAYCAAFAKSDVLDYRYVNGEIIGQYAGPAPVVRNKDDLIKGLRDGAIRGTFRLTQNKYPGLKVFGKTGTAPKIGHPEKWHGIFIGFDPYPDPKRAIIVVTDEGTGANNAAPIAFDVLKKLKNSN